MEQGNKELKLKLKVLEKIIGLGITEKDLSHFEAKDFWEIMKHNKLSEREGDMLIKIADAISKKQLYSFLQVNNDFEKKEKKNCPCTKKGTRKTFKTIVIHGFLSYDKGGVRNCPNLRPLRN